MTITLRNILTSIIFTFVATIALSAPTMGAAQQHLHDAADALHRAQTSANPIDDLQSTQRSLEEALHNKRGHRVGALAIVGKAIAELKAGDHIAADKDITAAINEIEKGVEAGHKNKTKG